MQGHAENNFHNYDVVLRFVHYENNYVQNVSSTRSHAPLCSDKSDSISPFEREWRMRVNLVIRGGNIVDSSIIPAL